MLPNGQMAAGCGYFTVLISVDGQFTAYRLQELAGFKQKVRIDRLAKALLTAAEGGIEQHSACVDGGDDAGQDGPPEIVDDYDCGETSPPQRPRVVLEIGCNRFKLRVHTLLHQPAEIDIDCRDRMPTFEKETGMAAAAASQIKY